MSTIRVAKKKEFPYIQIDKFAIDQDSRISWQAKGLLTYLIGKPDDWTIRIKDLQNRASNGRDSVLGIINELIEAGYIERERLRSTDGDKPGQFTGISYVVYEHPLHTNPIEKKKKSKQNKVEAPQTGFQDMVKTVDKSPQTENPDMDKPIMGFPLAANPTYSNNNITNNDSNNDEEESSSPRKVLNTSLIKRDIDRLKTNYPMYSKVVETIGAAAILGCRPVLPDEELILEKAKDSNIQPMILENIFDVIHEDVIQQQGGLSYELIDEVFDRFALNLKKGRINIDPIAWFKTTWFNARLLHEYQASIQK